MKKILLFARDPGGANTIIPLIKPLKQKGYHVLVFAKDVAISRFSINGIEAENIMSHIHGISQNTIEKFLQEIKPDFIITGTSADDMTDRYLWSVSGKLGIPSFAILDQWVNYGLRFSRYGVAEIDEYKKNRNHEYLPTKILVMDDLAKKEAVFEGLPEERILVTGQPYFEFLRNKQFDPRNFQKLKDKFEIKEDDFVVVFASEPIRETYKETSDGKHYWGYDEISTFLHLYEALNSISESGRRRIKVIVKLHPKENQEHYAGLISSLKNDNITVNLDRDSDALYMIKIADLVCGMSSMFLLESFLLQKPTISIEIGLNRENPFILDRIGIIKSILDQNQLNEKISAILKGGENKNDGFKLIEDPVNRVIDNMEKKLCQN